MSNAGKELGISNMMDMDYVKITRELAMWLKYVNAQGGYPK